MHAHARPPLTLPQRPLHRAHSLFLFRSFTHGVCRPPGSFPAHTCRYTSLAKCAYHKHTLSLFSSHRPCPPMSNTVPRTCTLPPLFSSISYSHTPPPST